MRSLALLLAAFALASCSRHASQPAQQVHQALGRKLADGGGTDLRLTPDHAFGLYLVHGQKPHLDGIPPQMILGELRATELATGDTKTVSDAVTNVPGGYLVTPDSKHALVLRDYDPHEQAGTLVAFDLRAGKGDTLAERVTYMLPSPDSKLLAFISQGVLMLGPLPKGPFRQVIGEAQTAHFSPDGKWMLAKRKLAAGGALLIVSTAGAAPPKKLAEQVGDFVFSPDAKHIALSVRSEVVPSTYDLLLASAPEWKAEQLAQGTTTFSFSPDGKYLGRTQGSRPELLGDLVVGPAAGGEGATLAKKVNEFEFSPDSSQIAYLDNYDIPSRGGSLGYATLPSGKPVRVGFRVPNFAWSQDSKVIAFVTRVFKPIYSIDLMLYPAGSDKAFKVMSGVFGYDFDPKSRYLLFRTNCLREGRACDLMKLELGDLKSPPKLAIQGIYTFRPSDDGDKVLVTYARMDASKLYDAAVLDVRSGGHKTVGEYIELPPLFTTKDGEKVVFIGGAPTPPGLYLAEHSP